MKVLFTASVMGHLENFHVPYMQYFKDQGFEVHTACHGRSSLPCIDRQYEIGFKRSPFSIENIRCYRQLKKIIRENNYDIIHCHTPVVGVLSRLAARRARRRGTVVIYTAHGFHFYQGAPRLSGRIFRFVEKWLCRYTDILITINSEDYAALNRYGFKPAMGAFKVPGVGVDSMRFVPQTPENKRKSREECGIGPGAFVFIFAGEYGRDKDQMTLLEAVSLLKKSLPEALLLLPGRGPMQDELERAIKRLGIADNVRLLGFRNDMERLLKAADVAVSSSVREGLGINLVEAMATGLPVVATRIRGHVDLVQDGVTGYLVGTHDAESFEDRLALLYRSPQARRDMGQNALEAVKPFLLDNAQAEMFRIYDGVIADIKAAEAAGARASSGAV